MIDRYNKQIYAILYINVGNKYLMANSVCICDNNDNIIT